MNLEDLPNSFFIQFIILMIIIVLLAVFITPKINKFEKFLEKKYSKVEVTIIKFLIYLLGFGILLYFTTSITLTQIQQSF